MDRSEARPPLVLINGYAATAADWDPTFVAALGRSFTVTCPDNRGVGDGPPLGDGELTIATMAHDVLSFMDERKLQAAPIAGWSMGGFIAQELARIAPDRVQALVLMSSDPGGPDAMRADRAVWERLTDCGGSPREQASRLIGLLFPPPVAEAIDRDFGDVVAHARAALAPATLDAQEGAMRDWHATEHAALPSEIPVLATAGVLDQVIPAANAARLAGDRCWLGRFSGGGHAFMAQEPERLAALIAAFLRT